MEPVANPQSKRASQNDALDTVVRIARRREHLSNQLTETAVGQLPTVTGSQLSPVAVGEGMGKPSLSAFLPRGKPYRYLSGNALKVHLYLLRRHQRKVPPHDLQTEWTLYGETTIARIAGDVGMKDRTVFRALDELVDFGLARRERRRTKGVVIGLAYWLLPAPKELTDQAVQRLKAGLINAELATEEAKHKLARDGIVFENDAERKADLNAMFEPKGNCGKDRNALISGNAPPQVSGTNDKAARSNLAPPAPLSEKRKKRIAASPPQDDEEWESSCPNHGEATDSDGACIYCADDPNDPPPMQRRQATNVKPSKTKAKRQPRGQRAEGEDLAAYVTRGLLKAKGGLTLPDIVKKVLVMGYKASSDNLAQAVYNVLSRMKKNEKVEKDLVTKTYSWVGATAPPDPQGGQDGDDEEDKDGEGQA